jgi:hypothetical protein
VTPAPPPSSVRHPDATVALDAARRCVSRDLALILLLALTVRVLRIVLFTSVVEVEGSEYGRIAENLLLGQGYVGLLPGHELMLPPLYSVCIAVMSLFTGGDLVLAGRTVSLCAGLITVCALYILALRQGGRVIARWTGVLAACLPILVSTSAAVFSESLLVGLLAVAVLLLWEAIRTGSVAVSFLCGLVFGLGYLARIESVCLAPGAALVLLVAGRGGHTPARRRGWARTIALLLGFLIAALPYPVYLYSVLGEVEVAGKSARVFATIERYSHGLSFFEANYTIDAAGRPEGPWLHPNDPFEGPSALTILERSAGAIAVHFAKNIVRTGWLLVTGTSATSLLILVACFLAWRRPGRTRETRALDMFLLWLAVYTCTVAAVYKVLGRYLTPLAIPAVLWGTQGLFESIRRRGLWHPLQNPGRVRLVGTLILALSASRGLIHGAEFDEASGKGNASVLEMGTWLRERPQERIMADDSRVPFYGDWTWAPLPVAPNEEALVRYAATEGTRYVCVKLSRALARPGPWLTEAGTSRLRLVHRSSRGDRAIFEIVP